MPQRFRSKIDWWIGLLIVGGPLAGLTAVLWTEGPLATAISLALILAVYRGLVFPMYYALEEDGLLIRFGLLRYEVPYPSLKQVRPTWNPLSSPALSLDRLHLDSGNSLGPNISPADKAGFLAALAEKTPHLRLEGDALVPVATQEDAPPA